MNNFIHDINEAASLLAKGSISSEELSKACLENIASLDKKVGAILHVDEDLALKAAKESDERRKHKKTLGILDGIPITLKDMILSSDMPTTAGSRILEGYVSPYEALVVKKLRAQGAVILAKTNLDEFAMGGSNENSAYKPCFNPWSLVRTPGGSSGGSAASVSANMALASLGTDTGGSIRQPAAYCGVVGLKPSYGRVSRFGIVAFASSLDQVGPLAKSVKGCAAVFSAIAGLDENDATSADMPVPDYQNLISAKIAGKKVGVPKEYFSEGINPSVKDAVLKSIDILKQCGCEIHEISLPHTPYAVATYYIIATAEASSNLARYDGIRYGARRTGNGSLSDLYEKTRGELFGKEVKRRIALGTYVLSAGYFDAYYLKAQKVRRLLANDFIEAFNKVDVIISPTTPTTAFKMGEKIADPIAMYLNDIYTIGANLAGLPGISVPVGFDEAGLPIGTQILGKLFDEQSLFDFAFAIEQELNLDLTPSICKKEKI